MSFIQVGDSKAKTVEDSGWVCSRAGYWKGIDFFFRLEKDQSSNKRNPNNTETAES